MHRRNIPSVALNVYTNGIAGVTDADCVYIGEWKKESKMRGAIMY